MWINQVMEWLEANQRTQAWLARNARINEGHLSQCLRGHRPVGQRTLYRLEKAMGLEPGELVRLRDELKPVAQKGTAA